MAETHVDNISVQIHKPPNAMASDTAGGAAPLFFLGGRAAHREQDPVAVEHEALWCGGRRRCRGRVAGDRGRSVWWGETGG